MSIKLKMILVAFIALINFSCEPIIRNDQQTLNEIFNRQEFDIEIATTSCFSGGTELFRLFKKENGYLLVSMETGKNHVVPQVKIDSLKSFMSTRIGTYYNIGCTISEQVRIGSFLSSVDFKHSSCSGEATAMNDFLDYYRLIYKED